MKFKKSSAVKPSLISWELRNLFAIQFTCTENTLWNKITCTLQKWILSFLVLITSYSLALKAKF